MPLLRFLLLLCLSSAALSQSSGSSLRADDLRIASVGYRLATRASSLCGDAFPATGLQLHHLLEYEGAGRQQQLELYALDRGPGVLAVVADSPAAAAGLVAGDTLLAVNGQPFPNPASMSAVRRSGNWRAPLEASENLLEAALRRGPADLKVWRNGTVVDLRLASQAACAARVRLAQSSQANAFSTGTHVIVTTRILGALRSDDELALVIGHELAHNILRHDQKAKGSTARAAEIEADRLGLKLAAAAGYDVRAAAPMWRRLYAQFGGGIPGFGGHPSLKARERAIEEVLAQLVQSAPSAAQPEQVGVRR